MTLKTLGIVAGCVILAFGTGWCTGASNRTSLVLDLSQTTLRADVAEVRSSILDARLSLTQSNFGDARRALQRASQFAERVQTRLGESGQADRVARLQVVSAHLTDADRLAAALDPASTDAAAEALRTLEASVPMVGP